MAESRTVDVLRVDGSVLHARGVLEVAELVCDGLLGAGDIFRGQRLGETDALRWALAVADEEPYRAFEAVDAIAPCEEEDAEDAAYLAYEVEGSPEIAAPSGVISGDQVSVPDGGDAEEPIEDDEDDGRAAEQPETD
jgi:hypothetical protein